MVFYENSHRLRDGAVVVYTRPGARKTRYHARLKIPGTIGYVIRALKTANLNEALTEAEDLFYSLKAEQKQGIDVKTAGNIKFKDLWKRFYEAHEAGLSIHRQRLHKQFATKYLVPYFGEQRVADMPDAFVEKYWDWRINFHKDAQAEKDEAKAEPAPADRAKKNRKFRPNDLPLRFSSTWS